ncbi:hypothetical protein HYR69_03800, partial [Candidatus Sumerlaeota bacterium]|nr:hypothetical protein [Candidatus Sumerlaeota bacterium]
MMPIKLSPAWEKILAILLVPLFLVIYTAGEQINLTYDGAAFIAYFRDAPRPAHPMHLAFGYVMHAFLSAGRVLHVPLPAAGLFQAAFFMSFAVLLFYLLLRRYGIEFWPAIIFCLLLGFNETTIENGTTAELYGLALFAVLVALHAFRSVSQNSSYFNAVLFWLSCVFMLSVHLGLAFFVLALHMPLIQRERTKLGQSVWLLRGATTTIPIILWLFFEGHLSGSKVEESKSFFFAFHREGDIWHVPLQMLNAPLYDFASYAGLILFPAAVGLGYARDELKPERGLFLWSSFLLLTAFSFWTADFGTFYLPLHPVWGLFSAIGLERIAAKRSRAAPAIFLVSLYAYALLFIFLPQLWRLKQSEENAWLAAGFIAVGIILLLIGRAERKSEQRLGTFDPKPGWV